VSQLGAGGLSEKFEKRKGRGVRARSLTSKISKTLGAIFPDAEIKIFT
jgi:hypothetical protein